MKKKIITMLSLISLISFIPLNVYAEDEPVTDANADFSINVTDTTPDTVVSYITTINQDINIDVADTLTGYAWLKVENKSNVPISVGFTTETYDDESNKLSYSANVEPIGNNTIPTAYDEAHPEQKYITFGISDGISYNYPKMNNNYIMSKDFELGVKFRPENVENWFNFASQNANVGLYKLTAKLSDNWIVEDTDELTYSVTGVITPNTTSDFEKEIEEGQFADFYSSPECYFNYDKTENKIYALVKWNGSEYSDINVYGLEGTNTDEKTEYTVKVTDEKTLEDDTISKYNLYEIDASNGISDNGYLAIFIKLNGSVNNYASEFIRTFYLSDNIPLVSPNS